MYCSDFPALIYEDFICCPVSGLAPCCLWFHPSPEPVVPRGRAGLRECGRAMVPAPELGAEGLRHPRCRVGDEAAPVRPAALLFEAPLFALSLGPPLAFSISASLGGKKSLDAGLALLSGFNRLRQLKGSFGKSRGTQRESSKPAASNI